MATLPFQAIALIATAASTAVSYRAAQNNAKAQEYAADAAEEQGKYNAQIDVNNTVQAADQADFRASAAESNKFRALEKAQKTRDLLNKKLRSELATERLSMNSSFGTFENTFTASTRSYENQLASFDFEASASAYGFNIEAGEARRQRQLAWDNGLAGRDLTLASAANTATQFRNQASNTRLGAVGDAFGSFASMAEMGQAHFGGGSPSAPASTGVKNIPIDNSAYKGPQTFD